MKKQAKPLRILDNYQIGEQLTEYSHCIFRNGRFEKADLSSFEFTDCRFEFCDLSMATLTNTVFARVHFLGCKMLGLDYARCNKYMFTVSYETSILDYSLFNEINLRKTTFTKCKMQDVHFAGVDMQQAVFDECDLSNAVFERCNLSDSDFRTSHNYAINPSENKVKDARFSYPGVLGLLRHLDIEVDS